MRTRALIAVAAVVAVVAATLITVGLTRQNAERPGTPSAAPAGRVPAPSEEPGTEEEGRDGNGPEDGGDEAADGERPAGGQTLPESEPVRVSIPSLGVESTLERLGKDPHGAMETPRDPDRAGWYTPGPTPGEQGPAVISGHVTWNGDRSVFFRLGEISEGDRIEVTREDGRTAEFAVERVARYPKAEFPTVEVYKNLDHAGLRLITCGGEYDESSNYYTDNVVVFASLTGGDGGG